jgi:cytochrome c oxidase assembly protein subunit 11
VSNRNVVMVCIAALAVMSGVTAYSPTLYKIFCQVTGYGGTTQRVAAPLY